MNANEYAAFEAMEMNTINSGCFVNAVFNEGDTFGFMYTDHAPQQDVFMLNVPRTKVEMMKHQMNVLAQHRLRNNEVFRGNGYVMRCVKVLGLRRKALLRTHLIEVDNNAIVYELVFLKKPKNFM